jgi:hypothetical protein
MRLPSRTPRVGLFVYAACTATELLLSAWSRHLLASERLALVAFVVLPLALAALVQFLRVAVPPGRTIRDRLGGHGAPP